MTVTETVKDTLLSGPPGPDALHVLVLENADYRIRASYFGDYAADCQAGRLDPSSLSVSARPKPGRDVPDLRIDVHGGMEICIDPSACACGPFLPDGADRFLARVAGQVAAAVAAAGELKPILEEKFARHMAAAGAGSRGPDKG